MYAQEQALSTFAPIESRPHAPTALRKVYCDQDVDRILQELMRPASPVSFWGLQTIFQRHPDLRKAEPFVKSRRCISTQYGHFEYQDHDWYWVALAGEWLLVEEMADVYRIFGV